LAGELFGFLARTGGVCNSSASKFFLSFARSALPLVSTPESQPTPPGFEAIYLTKATIQLGNPRWRISSVAFNWQGVE
jgi:hypothetical protein